MEKKHCLKSNDNPKYAKKSLDGVEKATKGQTTASSKKNGSEPKRSTSIFASIHGSPPKNQLEANGNSSRSSDGREKVHPDVKKWRDLLKMEKQPGWRPPARKKRVVTADEDAEAERLDREELEMEHAKMKK